MRFLALIFYIVCSIGLANAQIKKVSLAVDLSNGFTNSSLSGLYNNSFVHLGVDFKFNNSSFRFSGSYSYSTYIYALLGEDVAKNHGGNHSIQIQFLGGTLEYYWLDNSKRFMPFIRTSVLGEVKSNYENGNISYKFFSPQKFDSPPMSINSDAIYYGNHPYENMFGSSFYQSTPILFNIYGGISIRVIENFRVNVSAGYCLSVLNYKNVKWTKYDDRDEMIRKTPMQRKALHSIAGQVGLNYVFSFQKKSKIDAP